MESNPPDLHRYRGLIFDMDGVVTRTATVHARAWKETFDPLLQSLAETGATAYQPFDEHGEYLAHVDGLPRQEGVRRFLASRGLELPEGADDDPPEANTVHGVGRRKDERIQQLLREEGVPVFADFEARISAWRAAGLRTAIVSSSRNCAAMISAAGIRRCFDTRVDGEVSRELGLHGKPHPDIFLEAARRLGLEPAECVVFEDAEAGVRAAAAGGFGLVIGVARHGDPERLLEHGAHVAIETITELDP